MHIGRYIFAQITDFIPRYVFDKVVIKYKGDFHAKDLTCYNQLLHLLFGQLTVCDSLRDISTVQSKCQRTRIVLEYLIVM